MLSVSAMPAAAQDWRLISVEGNGDSALFLDVDSIRSDVAGQREFSQLIIFADDEDMVAAVKTRAQLRCVDAKVRIGDFASLDIDGGEVERSAEFTDWLTAGPDSQFAQLHDYVCNQVRTDLDIPLGSDPGFRTVRAMLKALKPQID